VPFAQGVAIGAILEFVSDPGRDLVDSLYDFGALGKHRFTFEVSDVVEIDVHGEPRRQPSFGLSTTSTRPS